MQDSPGNKNGRLGLVLQDGLSKPLAALIMRDPKRLHIQICSFVPSVDGQKSCGEHQGRPIYPWAVAKAILHSNQFEMKTAAEDAVLFRTDQFGSMSSHAPVKLVIKREGVVCASVVEEKEPKHWKCKVGAGVDPALILCFVACYDQFRLTNEAFLSGTAGDSTNKQDPRYSSLMLGL